MKHHPAELVVDEILEPEEFNAAKVSPIAPVNIDLYFAIPRRMEGVEMGMGR